MVSTFAGNGESGFKDGSSDKAQFYYPNGIVFDKEGNLYVAQSYAIRRIAPDGTVTTVIGAGTKGVESRHLKDDTTNYPFIDGAFLLRSPEAILLDEQGNFFVAEGADSPRIIRITPNQRISVFYGTPFSNLDGTIPYGKQLDAPNGLAFDTQGSLLITDSGLGIIKLTTSGSSYFTGNGYVGHVDGPATVAEFSSPSGAVFDKAGNLYVGDGKYIRKITPDGTVSTIAGSGSNSRSNTEPLKDGPANQAQISNPVSLAFDSKGDLYVVDDGGIRKITFK